MKQIFVGGFEKFSEMVRFVRKELKDTEFFLSLENRSELKNAFEVFQEEDWFLINLGCKNQEFCICSRKQVEEKEKEVYQIINYINFDKNLLEKKEEDLKLFTTEFALIKTYEIYWILSNVFKKWDIKITKWDRKIRFKIISSEKLSFQIDMFINIDQVLITIKNPDKKDIEDKKYSYNDVLEKIDQITEISEILKEIIRI